MAGSSSLESEVALHMHLEVVQVFLPQYAVLMERLQYYNHNVLARGVSFEGLVITAETENNMPALLTVLFWGLACTLPY